MLLTFLLAAALWNCNCWWNAANIYTFAVQPGYLDFDNLPDTNFSCDGKVIGGYYADVETGCQMFHVCTIGQKAEITDIKFLCLNGTVFDQETRVCERLDEVDCSRSESFFDLNLELYGNNGAGYGIAPEEPPEQEPVQCNVDEEECSGTPDYFDEEMTTVAGPVGALAATVAVTAATTTTTTTTSTTTTTPRTTTTSAATSTKRPSQPIAMTSTPKPTQQPAVSYPTNSPETIAALIALHNAFQESLKEREQGPGPKGQQSHHRYHPPSPPPPQQQQPKPFTVTNFQPPRHFPSKAPQQQQQQLLQQQHQQHQQHHLQHQHQHQQQQQPPPPPYRHQQQHLQQSQQQQQQQHPVLLSSERFGNQNFRHGFQLQNGPPPPPVDESPPPSSYQQQQYNGDGAQYDGNYDETVAAVGLGDEEDVDDEESRRNFAREAPESSVSVSVQVSSSSTKNSAINQQQQQQQRPTQVAVVAAAESATPSVTTTTTTMATATAADRPFTDKPSLPQPPPGDDTDPNGGDLYEDEYEELEGDEEFFKDVPKLGQDRRRRYALGGAGRA
ncbi:basic-leucine zipper transcription factor A [Acyrthosiphon pisum]|uniref:Chitin-binding type-2 domain-containing protein n=1 Tax=Acyrthosiphon pisum TaxID=7029 RepID=A0A8R1W2J6_ACYPI|nr:basic-leucine zipper transcription factor A [Acyrthosiphon pisum]|eukprot:XP_001950329.2 PREDICTED: basic-leucine zipper transcription factor A [Acyrthosiphon pisum]